MKSKRNKIEIRYHGGDKYWFMNNELHREGGPAIERNNGVKEWWVNSRLHREDGPAIECTNDVKFWFLNGIEYTEQEYKIQLRLIKLERIL